MGREGIETRILRSQGEMAGQMAESFGELRGLIAAIDPAQARAAKGEGSRKRSRRRMRGSVVIAHPAL
jgi:hypothetical protein